MITVSEEAQRILKLRLNEAASENVLGIRIKVNNAGCGGYAYDLEYSYKTNEEDIILDSSVMLVIDPFSMTFLTGTLLEYVREDVNEGFQFVNPNATGECGCGESFYI